MPGKAESDRNRNPQNISGRNLRFSIIWKVNRPLLINREPITLSDSAFHICRKSNTREWILQINLWLSKLWLVANLISAGQKLSHTAVIIVYLNLFGFSLLAVAVLRNKTIQYTRSQSFDMVLLWTKLNELSQNMLLKETGERKQ